MLTYIDWSLNRLYYCLRQETNLPQHARSMESSPSALDLWETTDLKAPSEALNIQARSNPTDYKKILSVRQKVYRSHIDIF